MTWFGRDIDSAKPKRGDKASSALPKTEAPEPAPRTPPPLSEARRIAVEKLIERGEAKSIAHAEFKARAGVIELPDLFSRGLRFPWAWP